MVWYICVVYICINIYIIYVYIYISLAVLSFLDLFPCKLVSVFRFLLYWGRVLGCSVNICEYLHEKKVTPPR